jgi:hypothetical protein
MPNPVRLNQLLGTAEDDKLNVAFVAEFSRGKSELINAIFFAGYKQRLLPSSAGRTTMCPTELLFPHLPRCACFRSTPDARGVAGFKQASAGPNSRSISIPPRR